MSTSARATLILVVLLHSQAALAQFNLRLQVQPTQPTDTTPISVTIADDFPDTCYSVCSATGAFINPTTYHIDWYILHQNAICAPVIITLSSMFSLGPLARGDYLVTATEYISPLGQPCMSNPTTHTIQTQFRVFARCDIDRDGTVGPSDVAIFVGVLLGNDTNPSHMNACDMNGDSRADAADVQPFVACMQ